MLKRKETKAFGGGGENRGVDLLYPKEGSKRTEYCRKEKQVRERKKLVDLQGKPTKGEL